MHRTLLTAWAILLAAAAPAPAQDVLVTTDWVWHNLTNDKVRLVEVSVDPGVYEKGHVRGAVGFRWYTDLCDRVRRDIVSPEHFEKLCRGAGISADSTVVLYGDNNNWFACWGYWIFTIYGHPNVKIMNGGRTKWELEKRPWDTTVPSHPPGNFRGSKPNLAIRARMNDVLRIVERKEKGVLVDVRSPDEYAGRVIAPPGIQELAIRAGRIPGARNAPWSQTVNPDGTFKPVPALRKLYADAGVDGTEPVVTYCRIGERSSHSWFVLKFLLGYDARNYDGSWTEYGNAVGVPIENEAGTIWSGK